MGPRVPGEEQRCSRRATRADNRDPHREMLGRGGENQA